MFEPLTPDDDFLSCDNCAAYGQCDEHIDPYSDEFDYDDPFDVVMYDIDSEPDDLYALIDMLGDSARSWYASRRLNALAASGPLRALVADIIIDSLGRRWNPLEHPRDRFGRFINTGGFFRWLGSEADGWLRARVERIDSDGVIHARSVGNDRIPDGQLIRFKPEQASKLVSIAEPVATLDGQPKLPGRNLDLDADIPEFPEASDVQKRIYNALADGNMPAEDIDRFYLKDENLTPVDFAAELTGLQDKGLIAIDREGTRSRVSRLDLGDDHEVDADGVADVPDDEVPELDDSPALTKEQRDLVDFIADLDRGEGDGVAFEEMDSVAEEDLQALVDAGVLDDADGRYHLVNPEAGGSELDAPVEEPDILDEILDAAEVLDDIDAQDAFQHFALGLADPNRQDELPLPEGLSPAKLRNAQQAADKWWAERNGDQVTPDPNVDPEAAAPEEVLNPRNQALADGLAEDFFNNDAKFLDSDEGIQYRDALKKLFDAADYEENGMDADARRERMRAEREFARINVPQEDIDGWPLMVENWRGGGADEAVVPEEIAPEDVVPEDVVPETPDPEVGITDVPENVDATPVALADRPGRALYFREDPDAQRLLNEGAESYEWGAVAAEKDYAAGLPEMSEDDHANLWGRNSAYAEGYRDTYEDQRRLAVPGDQGADEGALRETDAPREVVTSEPDVPEADAPSLLTNDEASRIADNPTADVPREEGDNVEGLDLGAWGQWQDRVAEGRLGGDDLNDEMIREKAVADELGLSLVDGNGLLSWTSFMQNFTVAPDQAEELYRKHNGDVGQAAMDFFMNRNDGGGTDTPNTPDADVPESNISFTPAASAVAPSDVPEYARVNAQEPFNIDDYPYITEDGLGLANREGRLVAVGEWYRAAAGGEGDPGELVGFFDQNKFPGWVLLRAPDGKLKGAHVHGQGAKNRGGLNYKIDLNELDGELGEWRAQRAARGGDKLDGLDQNNPANFLRGPNGRGQIGGDKPEVGMAVHYLGGGKKFGADNNGVISRIGWNERLKQPIIYVLVPGQDGGKSVEVAIAPEMLELRRDPVTVRTPTPDLPDVDAPGAARVDLPDREWQVPSDNELIQRMNEAADADGFVDYVGFVNAFVNPGVVAEQIDGLVDGNDRRFVRGAGPNGRPALQLRDRGAVEAPEVPEATPGLPGGAEDEFEGAVLNAIDAADGGLQRGAIVNLDDDDAGEKLLALRALVERGVLQETSDPDSGRPVFDRVPAPSEAAGPDGAENELEADILNAVDGGGEGGIRAGDVIDIDADDAPDRMAALRALVQRRVITKETDENGAAVYRRAPAVSEPTPMSNEDAIAAIRSGADPLRVANESVERALRAAGYDWIDHRNAGRSPNAWAVAPGSNKGPFPVKLPGYRKAFDNHVYMVKANDPYIDNSVLNEVISGEIANGLMDKQGRDAPGLVYHPRVNFGRPPKGMGAVDGSIVMDHAAYGYPEGSELVRGDGIRSSELQENGAADSIVRLTLYDYLINNAIDRHAANQMYVRKPDGSIEALIIDNGFGFGGAGRHGYGDADDYSFAEFIRNHQPKDLLRRAGTVLSREELRASVENFAQAYRQLDVEETLARIQTLHGNMSTEQIDYVRTWLTQAQTRAETVALDIDGIVDTMAVVLGI